jgi:2-keto-4-pentenoate hydratase
VLRIDGERVGPSPRADLVPANPGSLLVFVATFLEEFGESLEAGDAILTGSYTERAVEVTSGNRVCADFGHLGSVAVRIGAAGTKGPTARIESEA